MSHSGKPTETRLAEHDEAIASLLETLLSEVPEHPATALPPDVHPVVGKPLNNAVELPLIEEVVAEDSVVSAVPARPDEPAWAVDGSKLLIVEMDDVRIAVPLVQLNGIVVMPEGTTPMPGQPAWHQGITTHRGENMVVIDLAGLLAIKAVCSQPKYLLAIGDGRYGLACAALGQPVALSSDAVKWRHPDDERAWYAGMLREQMCVIVDVDGILKKIRHD